jgi:hypothetical protein
MVVEVREAREMRTEDRKKLFVGRKKGFTEVKKNCK